MNVFRKITTGVGAVALLCFSFYYTAMAAKFLRGNDELMLEIKSVASTYETGAIDASFNGDEMIPGLAGQKVDYDKSYSKMKNYGILNESDLVFTSVEPNSSIENVYDKYIVKGNDAKKAVALVFLVTDETYLEEINNILLTNDVPATFFLESNYIKNNKDFVKDLSVTNEIEPLGSSATYDKETILYDVSLIETITDLPAKYCFTKYANSDTLSLFKLSTPNGKTYHLNGKLSPYQNQEQFDKRCHHLIRYDKYRKKRVIGKYQLHPPKRI